MGASLTIKVIQDINKDKFSQKKLVLKKQTELSDFDFEVSQLGLPRTVIQNQHTEKEWTYYKVTMNTETINEPIFIYWEDIEHPEVREIKHYQRVLNFNFCIKTDHSEIRIFSAREEADLLIRRLRREKYLQCKSIKFDFIKIEELKDMESAWGVWEDHEGVERKRARFGKGINSVLDEHDYEKITTVYMDYNYNGEKVQLVVSVDGRISSNSKSIKELDLAIIYEEIRSVLALKT